MSFLTKWAGPEATTAEEKVTPKGEFAFFPVANPGKGEVVPAFETLDDRRVKARELLAAMREYWEQRARTLQREAGLSKGDAEKQAMREVKESEHYHRWRSL